MNVSDDSEDEAIAQQAAMAQARFGNQTKKPVANQDVSIDASKLLLFGVLDRDIFIRYVLMS